MNLSKTREERRDEDENEEADPELEARLNEAKRLAEAASGSRTSTDVKMEGPSEQKTGSS